MAKNKSKRTPPKARQPRAHPSAPIQRHTAPSANPPRSINPGEVQIGMAVLGRDGQPIGQVNQVRDQDFLLARPKARAVYVPFEACEAVEAGSLKLNVSGSEVDRQNWRELSADDVSNEVSE